MVEKIDRRVQILEAAYEEFAAKGYNGATIKSIAAAAGLRSPALIYWYFPDKEGLFREVLSSRLPILQAVDHPESVMKLPPKEALLRIGRAYFAFDRSDAQALKLGIGEAIRRPEVAEMFARDGPGKVFDLLKAYLERQIESGRLRAHDVRSSSWAFVGMLMPQLAGKLLFPALAEDGLSDEEHLKATTDLFLQGLEPESPRVGCGSPRQLNAPTR
jgi:AcrR family transcriptional regulator